MGFFVACIHTLKQLKRYIFGSSWIALSTDITCNVQIEVKDITKKQNDKENIITFSLGMDKNTFLNCLCRKIVNRYFNDN